ncbi:hypothetical protein D8Y22_04925 [Salinadaptatus halalkaliphilus]|uniref:Uncharacterized protein n=1 Tax=Salinadaptatus halalkaliphilus TaxID=2419781 RepID=A0A4S3TNM8_9EURY|nr:hypothetical protein D8Y22_04925 [Salinadaptatus halalkaliphilus]
MGFDGVSGEADQTFPPILAVPSQRRRIETIDSRHEIPASERTRRLLTVWPLTEGEVLFVRGGTNHEGVDALEKYLNLPLFVPCRHRLAFLEPIDTAVFAFDIAVDT